MSGRAIVPAAYPDVQLITKLPFASSVDPSAQSIAPAMLGAVAFRMVLLVTNAVLPRRAMAPPSEAMDTASVMKASATVRTLLSSAYTPPPAPSKGPPAAFIPALDLMMDVFATIHTSLRTMAKAPPEPPDAEFTMDAPARTSLVTCCGFRTVMKMAPPLPRVVESVIELFVTFAFAPPLMNSAPPLAAASTETAVPSPPAVDCATEVSVRLKLLRSSTFMAPADVTAVELTIHVSVTIMMLRSRIDSAPASEANELRMDELSTVTLLLARSMAPPDVKEVEFTMMMPIMTTELSSIAMAPPFIPGPACPLAIVRLCSTSCALPCTVKT
eukprot:5925067-Prymnesium_polylepis.1